nr:bifunctional uridylyltransferase/uridylyl-removing protein GlnD [Veronia pacifica]
MLLQPDSLTDAQMDAAFIREQLEAHAEEQRLAFTSNVPVDELVSARSLFMDQLLSRLWSFYGFERHPNLSLVAVGGYGRGELHPLSDIDLLLLSEAPLEKTYCDKISEFITLLWDLRLEIGHSVRTLDECIDVGMNDLTVATNLQEARLLCGSERLFDTLISKIRSENFWPSETFFTAKVNEQKQRHGHYHDTAYKLEPDIKSSPGGLRDIHTLSWVALRHFGATSLREMSKFGFLTDAEFRELTECQELLWRIRFALHLEIKRYDNRLTFAHQPAVAERMGYSGEGNQAVEMMMRDFFRTTRRIIELNKMLLQLFDQAIHADDIKKQKVEILSEDFQRRDNKIEARKPALFQARPDTILDMFIHIADDKSIDAISAPTLRQLRTARRRLNMFLCESPTAKEKFVSLTRHPNALYKAFTLMHRHGVMAAYFPQWSRIVGQMQFDLFHTYTVDEHTLRLLRQIESFSYEENKDKHPICCDVFPRIKKHELLILAAIFHDIGKGRGGDHSKIGAEEAYSFCIEHGFSRPESKLVSWLVENHLLMSITAQRRDIYDPDVITEFAKTVRDEERLEFLVCLTVADICATNPELWNSWKRTLLSELFYATQKALRRGLENPPDIRERIRHNQHLAAAILRKKDHSQNAINSLWQGFKADYFLRSTHKQIAWHSHHLLHHNDGPLVLVSKKATRGGTEIFVYTKDKPSLLARVVSTLDKHNLSIHDAQIMTSKSGHAMDTFMVLDPNGKAIALDRHDHIRRGVVKALKEEKPASLPRRRASRKLMAFTVETKVHFLPAQSGKRTLLELVALDAPGLLARVGTVFARLGISVQSAKVTTIGERAEDFFIIADQENRALDESLQQQLRDALIKALHIPQ